MKKSLLLFIALVICLASFAQNDLQIQHSAKGAYIAHKVAAKENFYSIGRLYNLAPKDIAGFNSISMENGLSVGQVLQIPLNTSNFSQSSDKGRAVFYVVGQKEGLYRVSLNNSNVLMANLRKWNRLSNDNISAGQKLIVGFIVSPDAGNIPVQTEVVEPPKETVKKDPPSVKTEVKSDPVERTEENPVKKEEKKPDAKPVQTAVTDGRGGYFKAGYEAQSRGQKSGAETTVTSGIFKTSSGWQDEKYYALMDGVDPGTIVKVTNPDNNKIVYVKVLGEMSGIRQNQGYELRISNAAASALSISDTEKFIVKVMR